MLSGIDNHVIIIFFLSFNSFPPVKLCLTYTYIGFQEACISQLKNTNYDWIWYLIYTSIQWKIGSVNKQNKPPPFCTKTCDANMWLFSSRKGYLEGKLNLISWIFWLTLWYKLRKTILTIARRIKSINNPTSVGAVIGFSPRVQKVALLLWKF